jgi:hypothetical protein
MSQCEAARRRRRAQCEGAAPQRAPALACVGAWPGLAAANDSRARPLPWRGRRPEQVRLSPRRRFGRRHGVAKGPPDPRYEGRAHRALGRPLPTRGRRASAPLRSRTLDESQPYEREPRSKNAPRSYRTRERPRRRAPQGQRPPRARHSRSPGAESQRRAIECARRRRGRAVERRTKDGSLFATHVTSFARRAASIPYRRRRGRRFAAVVSFGRSGGRRCRIRFDVKNGLPQDFMACVTAPRWAVAPRTPSAALVSGGRNTPVLRPLRCDGRGAPISSQRRPGTPDRRHQHQSPEAPALAAWAAWAASPAR